MKNKTKLSVLLTALVFTSSASQAAVHLDQIKLPPGFKITVFVNNVAGARSMTWGDQGTLFIGTRGNRVYAVETNGTVRTIAPVSINLMAWHLKMGLCMSPKFNGS